MKAKTSIMKKVKDKRKGATTLLFNNKPKTLQSIHDFNGG
jgi:hypothetical protein